MNHNRVKGKYIAAIALFGVLGAASAMPVDAATQAGALKRANEIQLLKEELAKQRAQLAEQQTLINKLLATQSSQKEVIEKIETRTTQAPEQAPAPSSAQTPAQMASGILKGLSWYGNMDLNIANANSGYGRKFTVGSGGMTATSIGLKGEKAIMDGLRAVFEVEMGIDLSTGVAGNGPGGTIGANNTSVSSGGLTGTGNQIFARQAYGGLASDSYGSLLLGRQYTGSYIVAATYGNAFGVGFYGNGGTFVPNIGGMPTRLNNSIVYRSPSLAGFSVYATYSVGNENNVNGTIVSGTSSITDSSGEGGDIALFYRYKDLKAALTGWAVKNASFAAGETGLATKKGVQAAVNYDFGFAKLYATYLYGEISGGNYENVTKTLSEADGWSVSASVPIPHAEKHTILASYAQLNDKSRLDHDGSLIGIAYTYKLYDKTWLYINWGKMMNKGSSSYSLVNGADLVGVVATPGYSPDGVMVGLNVGL